MTLRHFNLCMHCRMIENIIFLSLTYRYVMRSSYQSRYIYLLGDNSNLKNECGMFFKRNFQKERIDSFSKNWESLLLVARHKNTHTHTHTHRHRYWPEILIELYFDQIKCKKFYKNGRSLTQAKEFLYIWDKFHVWKSGKAGFEKVGE